MQIAVNTDAAKIRSVIVLQSVVYSLSGTINANLKEHFYSQFETPHGFKTLNAMGRIELHQKENFAPGPLQRMIGFEPDESVEAHLRRNGFESVLEHNKQETFIDLNIYNQQVEIPQASDKKATINLQMKVPEYQQILYTPNILYSLVELWVQYLAILIPVIYVLYYSCLNFAFNRQILDHK